MVNEFLEDGESVEFFITGYDIDSIYLRASTVGGGAMVGGGAVLAGYPMNDWGEYNSLYFTNKSIILLKCNKFLKAIKSCKVNYEFISTTTLYKKNRTLEILTSKEECKKIAVEFDKEVLDKYMKNINGKLIITQLNKRYSSVPKKAYQTAVGASVLSSALIGLRTAAYFIKDEVK